MLGIGNRLRRLWPAGSLLVVALLVFMLATFVGCGIVGGSQLSESVVMPRNDQLPGSTATPQPTSPQSEASQQEAESVVRSWFQDLAAGNYQQAESLTTGQALQQTQQLASDIQQQEQKSSVSLKFQTQTLDLRPATDASTPQGGQAVLADFVVHVIAQRGPLQLQARTLSGQAMFVVEPTPDGPKIGHIQNISGLSLQ